MAAGGYFQVIPYKGLGTMGALLGPLRMQIFTERERGLH